MKEKTRVVTDRLFEYLTQRKEFVGTAWDWAHELGIEKHALNAAISAIRSPSFIEENGWTIPFVDKHGNRNRYWLCNTSDRVDNEAMKISQFKRAEEMRKTNQRNCAQCEIAKAGSNEESRKHWDRALIYLNAAQMSLDAVVEDEVAEQIV